MCNCVSRKIRYFRTDRSICFTSDLVCPDMISNANVAKHFWGKIAASDLLTKGNFYPHGLGNM